MTRVDGVTHLIKTIRALKKQKAKQQERNVIRTCLYIQKESQKIVPVDTGALRNSAFTRKEGKGSKTVGIVGYTMDYAIYVHEDLDAQHAPGKTAKYLERILIEHKAEIRDILLDTSD